MSALFTFNIPTLSIILLCIAAICAILLLVIYRSRIASVAKHCQACQPTIISHNSSAQTPPEEELQQESSSAFSLDFAVETPETSILLPPLPPRASKDRPTRLHL